MTRKKPRPSDAFPPGAKLVWSDKDGKLFLKLPKGVSLPPPAPKPPSPSIEIIDRVLAGESKAAKQVD